jgi:serine/threonine-protein kinase HipA
MDNDPNSYSYEQLFQIMRKMRLPYSDLLEMFRRMVFNVAGKNLDDHTKNISFLLEENGAWRLSPAYDMIYNHNPEGKWTGRHQMSINGKREEIKHKDLAAIGEENSIRSFRDIIGKILEVLSNWDNYAAEADAGKERIKEIKRKLKSDIKK